MFGPDQPLDIDWPPTQLLAVDYFVARLPTLTSDSCLAGASVWLSTADSHPGNVPCSLPTLLSPRSLRFVCDFHYKSSALALNFSILLYIHYDREPLGIFSHVLCLCDESMR